MNDKAFGKDQNIRDFNFSRNDGYRASGATSYNYAGDASVDMGRDGKFSRKTNVMNAQYNSVVNEDSRREDRYSNDDRYNDRRYNQNPYFGYDTKSPYGEEDSFGDFCDQNPYTAKEQFEPINYSRLNRENSDYHQKNPYFERTAANVREEKPIEYVGGKSTSRPVEDFEEVNTSRFDDLDSIYSFRRKKLQNISSVSADEEMSTFRFENKEIDDFAQMPRIESKKKTKVNTNANFKLCIAVYVLIVAVIIAMIIANALIGSTAQASVNNSITQNAEEVNYGIVNGDIVELPKTNRNYQYDIEEETNWFDKLISSFDN